MNLSEKVSALSCFSFFMLLLTLHGQAILSILLPKKTKTLNDIGFDSGDITMWSHWSGLTVEDSSNGEAETGADEDNLVNVDNVDMMRDQQMEEELDEVEPL